MSAKKASLPSLPPLEILILRTLCPNVYFDTWPVLLDNKLTPGVITLHFYSLMSMAFNCLSFSSIYPIDLSICFTKLILEYFIDNSNALVLSSTDQGYVNIEIFFLLLIHFSNNSSLLFSVALIMFLFAHLIELLPNKSNLFDVLHSESLISGNNSGL